MTSRDAKLLMPTGVLLSSWAIGAEEAAEPVDMKQRAEELKGLKWGMFVCWSFSTFSGKEWTPGIKDVAFFKATGCDTDQWARTAKEAGMGYILFLTKHHDGFCLWDTQDHRPQGDQEPAGPRRAGRAAEVAATSTASSWPSISPRATGPGRGPWTGRAERAAARTPR